MSTIRLLRQILVLLLIILTLPPAVGVSGTAPAEAATLTFIVNSTTDAPDAHPGDGVCATSSGKCTLRAAIQEADAQPSGSSIGINVPSGAYTLTLGTLMLTANQITISGALSSTTTINGNNSSAVLAISPTVQASISGVTITGGSTSSNGGGIYNSGTLTLTNSIVSGNSAFDGGGIFNTTGVVRLSNIILISNTASNSGGSIYSEPGGTLTLSNSAIISNASFYGAGGIENGGTMTVTKSTIISNTASSSLGFGGGIGNSGTLMVSNSNVSGNTASDGGGGITTNESSTLMVSNSNVSGNTASAGGGIFSVSFNTLTVSNSAIISNTSSGSGGGIWIAYGPVTVGNSTISGNTASSNGGGIYIDEYSHLSVLYSTLSRNAAGQGSGIYNNGFTSHRGTSAFTGTILSSNVPGGNCRGPITETSGYNLDSGTSCHFSLTTDITDTLPHLGPLRDNGGPTRTMALLPGSPAIDHGGTHATGCPSTDQRGLPRPDEASDGGICDMGAYESQGIG